MQILMAILGQYQLGGTSSSPVEITLTENITTPSTASRGSIYFKIESDYIIFNGNNKTITYDSGNYPRYT